MSIGSCCMFTSGILGALLLVTGVTLFVSGVFQTLMHNKLKRGRLVWVDISRPVRDEVHFNDVRSGPTNQARPYPSPSTLCPSPARPDTSTVIMSPSPI
ncbi:hypothetical protein DPX16_1428 [Anabarilius grahami]|uniref:Uncharacterized protein n=1 Tax=Anabarilius grahami TaxID=495550 RepID=A0A3N0YLM9_ANAGA|nr:hypothetical protein DPX16_1428 [Anabarilius grahami]